MKVQVLLECDCGHTERIWVNLDELAEPNDIRLPKPWRRWDDSWGNLAVSCGQKSCYY